MKASITGTVRHQLQSASRMRRYRARLKVGRVVLRVPVDQVELALALIEAGMLKPSDEDNRTAIEAAVAGLLTHFSAMRDA